MTGNEGICYFVVPCYNEEEVLYETGKRLYTKVTEMMDRNMISCKSRIVFVDDGSQDRTWDIISKMHEENSLFLGIKSSRNRGHQHALLEGLMMVKDMCDMAVSMDADLQDDIGVLEQFVQKYYDGCDIVYGIRSTRETDTIFKRVSAESFYKILGRMGVEVIFNHADYRLMSRRALEELVHRS